MVGRAERLVWPDQVTTVVLVFVAHVYVAHGGAYEVDRKNEGRRAFAFMARE